MTKTDGEGTLQQGSFHPAAESAIRYIKGLAPLDLLMYQDTFASLSISGNKLAEICCNTLERIIKGDPISDRYLLGLAWTIKCNIEMREDSDG